MTDLNITFLRKASSQNIDLNIDLHEHQDLIRWNVDIDFASVSLHSMKNHPPTFICITAVCHAVYCSC